MRVICRKAISRTTGEDLGESSPWVKVGKEYTVLAINYAETSGFDIYIQTEDYDEPRFICLTGFEILNQTIPSSWITVISDFYGKKVVTMLPASWNYDGFFEDLDDQKPEAIALFNKEAELIYKEARGQT